MKFLLFNIAVLAALAYLFLQPTAEQTDELTATATRVGGEAVSRTKATIEDLVSEFRNTPRRSEIQVSGNDEAPGVSTAPERPTAEREEPKPPSMSPVEPLQRDEAAPSPAERERGPLPPVVAVPLPTTPLTPLPTVEVARVEATPPRPVIENTFRQPRRRDTTLPKRSTVSSASAAEPEPVFMSRRERARELNRLAREMETFFVERLPE